MASPFTQIEESTDEESIKTISLHRQHICPIYERIFYYAKIFGILPYHFNVDTFEFTPINSGFSYYVFLFNVIYVFVGNAKVLMLLLPNWWTKFELEEIPGGYFMQLGFMMGYCLLYAMIYSYCLNKNRFASAMSACILLEEHIMDSKLVPFSCSQCIM